MNDATTLCLTVEAALLGCHSADCFTDDVSPQEGVHFCTRTVVSKLQSHSGAPAEKPGLYSPPWLDSWAAECYS